MLALMTGAIAVFGAYVTFCDRVVETDDRSGAVESERVA